MALYYTCIIFVLYMGCGTILQLISYRSQDIYLTGNPHITFWKWVYKRHTNFVMESIPQLFVNTIKLPKGNLAKPSTTIKSNKFSAIIDKKADLIYDMYLEIELTEPLETKTDTSVISAGMIRRPAYYLIQYVEMEIGGEVVDRLEGEWLDMWFQLSQTHENYIKWERLINGSLIKRATTTNGELTGEITYKFYVPLPFWFCKNYRLALPLIALKYNEVKFNVCFRNDLSILRKKNDSNTITTRPTIKHIELFCDSIFLDLDEKKKFRTCHYEYLVEQVQYQGNYTFDQAETNVNIKLKFSHPVKELFFICQDSDLTTPTKANFAPFSYNKSNNGTDLINKVRLLFNNNLRFAMRESTYFRTVQLYQHHTAGGYISNNKINLQERGFIYVYSFALDPEEYQPSGTCNFSRIDVPQLWLTLKESIGSKKNIRIYAKSYNVFRLAGGMGGLLYV